MPELALTPTTVIPVEWRRLFPYTHFNRLQSTALDDAYGQDNSLVVCAPTGSGKTCVLELALARLWSSAPPSTTRGPTRPMAIYIAPLKALTHERRLDWEKKLGPLGISVVELTGDSVDDGAEERAVHGADLIVTTPEKWDSFSRFRRDAQGVMGRVALLLVDEVHLLNDPSRGPFLESVVTRMRTISASAQVRGMPIASLRVLCVSATMSNVEDIATWLGPGCLIRRFDESYRPVKLVTKVIGYPMGRAYSFDQLLVDKLFGIIKANSSGRPSLVFCNSRKVCGQAATAVAHAAGPGGLVREPAHRARLVAASAHIADSPLRELLRQGVGFHNASLVAGDRQTVVALFLEGVLPVVCATAGLAQGVNFPARLVVLLNTAKYVSSASGYEEYSKIEVQQMAGRAGRPQFDDSGVCVIMTREEMKQDYTRLLGGTETIESHMHSGMLTHLNAEIAFTGGYMSDISVCLLWLRSTFFFTRVRRDPAAYRLPAGLDERGLEARLRQLVMRDLTKLASAGMVAIGDDGMSIQPQPLGTLMARFCVQFDTMASFSRLPPDAGLPQVITLLSEAAEFQDLYAVIMGLAGVSRRGFLMATGTLHIGTFGTMRRSRSLRSTAPTRSATRSARARAAASAPSPR